MTRKHFQAITDSLKDSKPDRDAGTPAEYAAVSQWREDCNAIADALRSFNGRFDRDRFLCACTCTVGE